MTITDDDGPDDLHDLDPAEVRQISRLLRSAAQRLDLPTSPTWVTPAPAPSRRRWPVLVAAAVVVTAVGATVVWRATRTDHVTIGTTPTSVAPPLTDGPWYLPSWMPDGQDQVGGSLSRFDGSSVPGPSALARNGERWMYARMVTTTAPAGAEHVQLAGHPVAITEVEGPSTYIALSAENCPLEIIANGLTRAEVEAAAALPITNVCGPSVSDATRLVLVPPPDLGLVDLPRRAAGDLDRLDVSYSSSSSEHWGLSWSVQSVPEELLDVERTILAHSLNTVSLRGTTAALNGIQNVNPALRWIEPGTNWEINVTPCCDGMGGGPGPDPLADITRFAEGLHPASEADFRAAVAVDEFDAAAANLRIDDLHAPELYTADPDIRLAQSLGPSDQSSQQASDVLAFIRVSDTQQRLSSTRGVAEWAPKLLAVVERLDPGHIEDYRAELRRWGARL